MSYVCNVCGKEYESENDVTKRCSHEGVEYYICDSCDKNGIELTQTTNYILCKKCGYPHKTKEYKGLCSFCGGTDCAVVYLTAVEEELLQSEPEMIYSEKLGKDIAEDIVSWQNSEEKKAVMLRHRKDRITDTFFVVGIIIGYILLEYSIRGFLNDKFAFVKLLVPTVGVIVASPIFKVIDHSRRERPLPLWALPVVMALIVDLYLVLLTLV